MNTFLHDLRYGLRLLGRTPGFTAVAVLALALGIGANTAIFSVVNAVLLRPLPYQDPDRLTMIFGTDLRHHITEDVISYPAYLDWKAQASSFEQMEAWGGWSFNLAGERPEHIWGLRVTPGLFSMFGVAPAMGRGFLPEEQQAGRNHVIVLSHALWKRRFSGDPGILGRQINLTADTDTESYTVVGVMPAGFEYTGPLDEAWVPLVPDPNRGHGFMRAVGKLKPGVSLARAQAEMNTISAALEKAYPREQKGYGANVVPLHRQMVGDIRSSLLVLLGAVAFVLLIACANVASLLLARATARQREMAIRFSLGAGRLRLIRQFLTESVLLAILGGTAGLLLATWGIAGLVGLLARTDIPVYGLEQIRIDPAVLGFTLLVSVVTGMVFGIAPALEASRGDVNEALKEGGRTTTAGGSRARLRKLLVISEVAISLVLLIGAGLLMKSFVLLERVPPGFRPEKLLTMNVQLPRSRYPEPRMQAAFLDQALARIAALPAVRSAGSVNALPMSGSQDALSFEIQNDAATLAEPRHAGDRSVNADYFRTMGMRIIKGRAFTGRDNAAAPKVAIVNESMAKRFWPNQDPIGKRISTDYQPPVWREIVGVVEDVRHSGYDSDPAPEMYFPYSQHSQSSIDLVVRTETDPLSLANAVERAIWAVDKDQPVTRIKTMERMMADSVAPRRLTVVLIGIFASLALVLATAGIYGVISYTVSQRTHEIGVRMAMGARSVDVLKLVVGQGLRLVAIGVAAGLAGSFVLTRVLARFLFGVTPTDPLTFAAVSVLLVTVALLASYIPARRAAQVDPVNALRYE